MRDLECLEGDDRFGIRDAVDNLHLFADEMSDVGFIVDIELDQKVVITGGRIDFRRYLSVGKIVGDVSGLEAISIGWDDDVDEASKHIEEAIQRVDRGKGVLLMTDMFGGTPTNLSLALMEKDRVEIVTGVNLPMLIKFTNLREELGLKQAADRIVSEGRQAIHVASQILEADASEPETGGSVQAAGGASRSDGDHSD